MSPRAGLGALLFLGASWGLTIPLTKLAVSTGHPPMGLIFWQALIGACVLGLLRLATGKPVSLRLPYWRTFLMIACLGKVLPNSFSFLAAAQLPAGIMGIVISLVPVFAFPVALVLGNDRFSWARLAGIMAGLCGVLLLAGPQSLPEAGMALWLPVALIAPFCYAMEGNLVAKLGTQGMGPGHTLFGASVAAMLISLPLALGSGQFIDPRGLDFGLAEWALAVSASVNVLVYSGYVWLVGRSGAVFASQIAYVVTGSGVVWAMVLLGESYSAFVWLALVLILGGVFLVQPRHKRPMVAEAPAGQGGPAAQ
jgi:drug/metabolite transporter (DMT)-like permease